MAMGGRNLLLIFGTETGNAEELAEDAGHLAGTYDLIPTVMDMEDISMEMLSRAKRLIVICSTWGEGEQPVNAQDLYDSVQESEEDSMEGVNYAVLALGDTAFEFYCESGKEWDTILEEKGGSRVNDRIDCDLDYDDYAADWIRTTLEIMKQIE
ncbi:MAG TPA: flavodoxin domain-containing protein [Candidatus Thalassarchaeaceae archaeon]|jgi:sulfite reductase (NADPH) flavoprotein alpha-component|nr:flavodoxin domain-containing protein [Candidatus Thalassarchaeaceae archaeon]